MDYTSVLAVLVTIDGLDKANRQVADFNSDLEKAAIIADEATAEVNKFGRSNAAARITVDATEAHTEIASVEHQLDGLHDKRVVVDVDRRGSGGGGGDDGTSNDLHDLGDGGRDGADGLTALGSAMSGLPGGFSGLGAAVFSATGAIAAMIGPAAALASALAPLSGLLAGGAGAAAAAGQGFGVFKLATMGVADALKETDKAQAGTGAAALASAAQQRTAANQILSAQDSLTTAQEAARNAQTSLTQARTDAARSLVDMRSKLVDATNAEAAAVLGLTDAKRALAGVLAGTSPEDLAKAQAGVTSAVHDQEQAVLNLQQAQQKLAMFNGSDTDRQQLLLDVAQAQDAVTQSTFGRTDAEAALKKAQAGPSDEDKQKALLAVKDAQQQLSESTTDRLRQAKDTAAADQAGVAGSKQVVAAMQQVDDTNRSVARAVRALADAQAAAKASADSAASSAGDLHAKLDALPAPAQAFVKQLEALKPKLDDLRGAAAGGFFPGASDGLTAAMGSFQSVKNVIGETSGVLGDFTKKAGEMVGSAAWSKDIQSIGSNNAKTLGLFGDASLKVADALRNVMVAAEPLTHWLGELANQWADQIDKTAAAGRANGTLADFFERTRQVAEKLFDIIGHVADGLFGMGKAGTDTGGHILDTIDRLSKRFDEWANSVGGQTQLRDFFRETTQFVGELASALGGVAKAFATIGFGPLSAALKIFGDHAQLITSIFLGWKIFATVINGIGTAIKAFGAAMEVLNAVMDLNPIVLVVGSLVLLGVALVEAYKHSQTFRDIVQGAFRDVSTAFEWLKTAAIDVFNWVKANWPLLLGILTGPIGLAVAEIATHWTKLKADVSAAWGWVKDTITGAVSAAFNWVVGFISRFVSTGANIIKAIANGIAGAGDTVKNYIVGAISSAWNWINGFLSRFVDIGKAIVNGIVNGIKSAPSAIGDAIKGIAGSAVGAVKGFLGIHSPSTVFAEIGGNVAQGMALGITNGAADVHKAVAAMNAITNGAITGPLVAGGSIAGTTPVPSAGPRPASPTVSPAGGPTAPAAPGRSEGVTQNFYGPIGSQKAADILARKLAHKMRFG